MAISMETGVVLRVKDEASPTLERVAKIMKDLAAQSKMTVEAVAKIGLPIKSAGMFAAIDKQFEALVKAAGTTRKAINEEFARPFTFPGLKEAMAQMQAQFGEVGGAAKALGSEISGSLGAGIFAPAIAATETISRNLREAAAAAASLGGAGAWNGRGAPPGVRGRSHSRGGPHISNPGIGLPTGSHIGMPGGPALAGIAALGYGMFEEGEMQDSITKLLYHSGQKNTPENRDKYREIMQQSMSESGYSLKEISEATQQEIRMFKGTPSGGLDVLPEMLRAATTEARLKGTSVEESMSSLIGLSHMTKQYDPEAIKKLAPAFAFLSASNPSSLASMERAAGYAVPILQSGLDMDPMSTLLMGTVLTRAGVTSTKSGTWLRNMFQNALPGTSLMSKQAYKKHEEVLKELGLVDDQNKPTWFTDGKPDAFKMLDIASQRASQMDLTKRAASEKALFGVQGEGAFALLSDPAVKEQIGNLKKEMNSSEFKNRYSTFSEDYAAGSPIQAARKSWADLSVVLMDIGRVALPPVVAGLQAFDGVLKNIEAVIKSPKKALDNLHDPSASGEYVQPQSFTGGSLKGLIHPAMLTDAVAASGSGRAKIADMMAAGTEGGVLQGLIAASGNAKAIIASWFSGGALTPGIGEASLGGGGGGGGFAGGGGGYGGGGGSPMHHAIARALGGRAGLARRLAGGGGAGDHGHSAAYWKMVEGGNFDLHVGAGVDAKAQWLVGKMQADFGLTRAQASGAVGWMLGETAGTLSPTIRNPGGGDTGWAQWVGNRRAGLLALGPLSDATNYAWMKHELETNYAPALANLRRTGSMEEALYAWGRDYEGAGGTPNGMARGYQLHIPFGRRVYGGGSDAAKVDTEAERERRRAAALSSLHAPAKAGGGQQVINLIKLDGRTIHRSILNHAVAAATHPRQAPYHDAGNYYSSVDYGFSTG